MPSDVIYRRIAAKVLGKSLRKGIVIHHIDGNRSNNSNSNLVVCEDQEYHGLIHRRTNAIRAGYPANWEKCSLCKQYESPGILTLSGRNGYHQKCNTKYKQNHIFGERSSICVDTGETV